MSLTRLAVSIKNYKWARITENTYRCTLFISKLPRNIGLYLKYNHQNENLTQIPPALTMQLDPDCDVITVYFHISDTIAHISSSAFTLSIVVTSNSEELCSVTSAPIEDPDLNPMRLPWSPSVVVSLLPACSFRIPKPSSDMTIHLIVPGIYKYTHKLPSTDSTLGIHITPPHPQSDPLILKPKSPLSEISFYSSHNPAPHSHLQPAVFTLRYFTDSSDGQSRLFTTPPLSFYLGIPLFSFSQPDLTPYMKPPKILQHSLHPQSPTHLIISIHLEPIYLYDRATLYATTIPHAPFQNLQFEAGQTSLHLHLHSKTPHVPTDPHPLFLKTHIDSSIPNFDYSIWDPCIPLIAQISLGPPPVNPLLKIIHASIQSLLFPQPPTTSPP